MKKKRYPLYAYQIHISAQPQTQEEEDVCIERPKAIADVLSKSAVKVTEQKPTHIRCRTSAEFEALFNLIRPIGVKREDVK